MKKFLSRLLLFAILSAGIYVLLVFVLSRVEVYDRPLIYRATDGLVIKGGDAYSTFVDYRLEKEPHDILIFGSSHAYRGYDPAIFEEGGYRTFNLGSNNQSPCQSLVIFEDVARLKEQPTILLDIYPTVFYVGDFESTSTLVANVDDDRAASRIAWGLGDIRSINMWTLRMVYKGREPILGPQDYAYKGYAQKDDSVSTTIDYLRLDQAFTAEQKQSDCLREILRLSNEMGLRIILVSHPRPLEIGGARHHTFIEFFDELAQEYDFEMLDYSFDHELVSSDHFYDHTHLNTAGVGEFNRRLVRDLHEMGVKGSMER